jgi:hypothetical protein
MISSGQRARIENEGDSAANSYRNGFRIDGSYKVYGAALELVEQNNRIIELLERPWWKKLWSRR